MEYIIKKTAEYFNLTIEDLKSKSRKGKIPLARQICFKILRGELDKKTYDYEMSLSDVGKIFNRDHTTVIYGINVLNNLMEAYPNIKEAYNEINKVKSIESEIIDIAISIPQY